MGTFLLAVAAAAVALYVWNALAWMALPHHKPDFRAVASPKALEDALLAAKLAPGIHTLPHVDHFAGGFKDPALAARWAAGPNAMIVSSAPGAPMKPTTFLFGFLLNVAQALTLGLLLRWSAPAFAGLGPTVGVAALLGLVTSGGPHLAQAIWMNFPWRHALMGVIDSVVGYEAMGLVLHAMNG